MTLLILVLVAALVAFTLTPVVVRQYRLWENAKLISGYKGAANQLSPPDCDTLLAQAHAHNQALESVPWMDPYAPDPGEAAPEGDGGSYTSLLNPAGNGVMAVLEVPKLGISLAVYHGGESGISTARVEHVPQSRLPSRDADGPCLLRVAQERFFNPFAGLDRLIVGDYFLLHVLQETWSYEVFQVAVATPEELEGFQSVEGDDECAMVAATTVRGEEARIVIRGRRVPRHSVKLVDDSRALPGGVPELIFAAPVAAVGLVLLAIVEGFRRAVQRHKRRRMKL